MSLAVQVCVATVFFLSAGLNVYQYRKTFAHASAKGKSGSWQIFLHAIVFYNLTWTVYALADEITSRKNFRQESRFDDHEQHQKQKIKSAVANISARQEGHLSRKHEEDFKQPVPNISTCPLPPRIANFTGPQDRKEERVALASHPRSGRLGLRGCCYMWTII